MDERVKLANEISKLILKNETDIKKIISEVNKFDDLLEDTIRNFYEIKQDEGVPLFELCEHLKLSVDDSVLNEEEYNNIVESLVQDIDKLFGVTFNIRELK